MRARQQLVDVATLCAAAAIVIATPDVSGTAEHVVLSAVAIVTTIVVVVAAVVHRRARRVWGLLAASSIAYTAHRISFLFHTDVRGPRAVDIVTPTLAGVAAALGAWGGLLAIRPLFSHASTRRAAIWGVPLATIGGCSVPLSDATLYPGGRNVWGVLVLATSVASAVALMVTMYVGAKPLRGLGRSVELRLIAALVFFVLSTVAVIVVDEYRYWAVPPAVTFLLIAAAAVSMSAGSAGLPLDSRPMVTQARWRWAIGAALPTLGVIPAIQLGAPVWIGFPCFAATIVTYLLFTRDIKRGGLSADHRPSDRSLAVTRALAGAIVHDELELHYQPIVRLRDGQVLGFEGLLRWNHHSLGRIDVEDILAGAGRAGLEAELDGHVIEQACRDLPQVLAALRADEPYLAVNLSPTTLQRPGFAASVLRRLDEIGASIDGLAIEIVERGHVSDWATLRENVGVLQDAGAVVALDDFGTGTSNLHYLSEIDADFAKLDRSLVTWAATATGRAVIHRVIEMTRVAGLRMVAEGVEDRATVATLMELGVEAAQGYLFGRPAPLADALAALESTVAPLPLRSVPRPPATPAIGDVQAV